MKECGEEIIRDAQGRSGNLDFFVLALGNGSSARGVGQVLPERSCSSRNGTRGKPDSR